jgi:RNA polymerase sigma factor FliA
MSTAVWPSPYKIQGVQPVDPNEEVYGGRQTGTLPETEARNQLILATLSQVYFAASQIHARLPQHVPYEDLVHAGVLGLIDAVHKYNPNKNASLKSFASFRIRGAIFDSLRVLDWGTRPLRRKGRDISESASRLAHELGRQPTDEEIALDLEIEVSELREFRRRLDGLHMVGQTAGSHPDDSGPHDLIESASADESENPFELCLRSERSEHLAQALQTLSEKEQLVITLYYREEQTMRDIAAIMNLAESRVSQIHSRAISKLRETIQSMELAEEAFR